MNSTGLASTGARGEARRLDRAVAGVLDAQNCSGCGACTLLDPALEMRLDEAGFSRPVRSERTPVPRADAARVFDQVCPGRQVVARHPDDAAWHPSLGPVVSAWEAWASDPELRRRGSSGGALTALSAWLTAQGTLSRVVAAQSDPAAPSRTVSVSITTRDEALAAAGSRYGPVSALAAPDALRPGQGLVGKPCEVAAARALLDATGVAESERPVLLSFFCAGTPSQHATDQLIADLGLEAGTPLREMWYRGRGWPGRFTAVATDGTTVSTTYDESWGARLGPAVQWRCKICPDGVGESADISAADFWHTDERGYPDFTEGDGVSAVLARTARGHALVLAAIEAGVLDARPLRPDALAAVQPLQVSRRATLLGRLVGTRLAGRPVPRYRGFGLVRLARRAPREALRTGRGSFRRIHAGRKPAP